MLKVSISQLIFYFLVSFSSGLSFLLTMNIWTDKSRGLCLLSHLWMQIRGVQVLIIPLDIFAGHSFIRIDILAGEWRHCHSILESPQKAHLHELAAEMDYGVFFWPQENAHPRLTVIQATQLQTHVRVTAVVTVAMNIMKYIKHNEQYNME